MKLLFTLLLMTPLLCTAEIRCTDDYEADLANYGQEVADLCDTLREKKDRIDFYEALAGFYEEENQDCHWRAEKKRQRRPRIINRKTHKEQ